MPGRCDSPISAISGYLASRPLTSVPVGIARAGMHDEAGRLVDDDHVLVVVDDRELDGRVGRRKRGRRQLGLVDIDRPVRAADASCR